MTRQVKTYNPNHVFVDTNVLIGAYSGDERFKTDSDCLHYLYSIVRELQHRFTIINFTVKDIDAALDQTGADIEDNVQFVLARKQKCRVIITNNYKDYRLLLGAQIIKPSKVRTIAR